MKIKLFAIIHVFLLSSLILHAKQNVFITDTLYQDSLIIDTSEYIAGDWDYNLMVAASKGYHSEVYRLLSLGANPNAENADGVTSLMYAADIGDLQSTRILVLNGAEINLLPRNRISALLSAVLNENFEVAEFLIQNGAVVSTTDWEGKSPLIHASIMGSFDFVDMLLYHGADISQQDKEGYAPVHYAALYGYNDIVNFLLDEGADPEIPTKEGLTPLMTAAQGGDTYCVEALVKKGVDVNNTSNNGQTALALAIINEHKDIVDYLIQHGANVNQKISHANSPLSLAKQTKNEDIISQLKQHGAKTNPLPFFQHLAVGADVNMNHKDFMGGVAVGFHEIKYKLFLQLNYNTRFFSKRVLVDIQEQTYQVWERRSYLQLGLEKYFPLTTLRGNENGFFAGITEIYTYGRYQSVKKRFDSKFIFTPKLGYYTRLNKWLLKFAYNYQDFSVDQIPASRLSITVSYLLNINKHSLY